MTQTKHYLLVLTKSKRVKLERITELAFICARVELGEDCVVASRTIVTNPVLEGNQALSYIFSQRQKYLQ